MELNVYAMTVQLMRNVFLRLRLKTKPHSPGQVFQAMPPPQQVMAEVFPSCSALASVPVELFSRDPALMSIAVHGRPDL